METHTQALVNPDKIHLRRIAQIGFSVQGNPQDSINLHTHFSSAVSIDEKANALVVRLTTAIRTTSIKNDELAAKADFEQEYHFQVDNLPDLINTRDGHQLIDQRLVTTLISISISTARGIVWAQTKGTLLEDFVLPVVNPSKIVYTPDVF